MNCELVTGIDSVDDSAEDVADAWNDSNSVSVEMILMLLFFLDLLVLAFSLFGFVQCLPASEDSVVPVYIASKSWLPPT
jgi:hypothetical protein